MAGIRRVYRGTQQKKSERLTVPVSCLSDLYAQDPKSVFGKSLVIVLTAFSLTLGHVFIAMVSTAGGDAHSHTNREMM